VLVRDPALAGSLTFLELKQTLTNLWRNWSHTSESPPEVFVVVFIHAREDVATAEVQVVGADGRVRRRRPIAPVGATTDERSTANVAGINKIIRIVTKPNIHNGT